MVNPGYYVSMPRTATPAAQRVLARTVSDGECLVYQGAVTARGYGKVWSEGRTALAHRVVYEALVGPIPEGLELDHTCKVKRCVNTAHLEPVTSDENMHRTRKETCKWGHDMATHARPIGNTRRCWECHKRDARKYRAQSGGQ